VIKYHKKKKPEVRRTVVKSLERGLEISLNGYEKLGEYEKTLQVEIDLKSLQLLTAAIATEALRTNEHKYSEHGENISVPDFLALC